MIFRQVMISLTCRVVCRPTVEAGVKGCKAQLSGGHAANLEGTPLHYKKRTPTNAESNRVLRRRCAIFQRGVLCSVQRTVAYIARPQKNESERKKH